MRSNHEIDYKIYGEEMQYVEITLDPTESAIAEAGSFMMMEENISMETIFGDGNHRDTSFMGKMFSAGKRLLTGESLFMTGFTNIGHTRRNVSFAAPYPGKIIPLDLLEMGGKIIAQKDSFLCAARGVSVGIEFQRKLGTGLFGGEGFIMQKLEGDGMVFVHAGGHVAERTLERGQVLRVDTGCIVAYSQTIDYDIEFVKGVKNVLFGGEGMFYATLRGPGKVWLQTIPISRLASRIVSYGGLNRGKEGGSILGGLGNLLDGDGL